MSRGTATLGGVSGSSAERSYRVARICESDELVFDTYGREEELRDAITVACKERTLYAFRNANELWDMCIDVHVGDDIYESVVDCFLTLLNDGSVPVEVLRFVELCARSTSCQWPQPLISSVLASIQLLLDQASRTSAIECILGIIYFLVPVASQQDHANVFCVLNGLSQRIGIYDGFPIQSLLLCFKRLVSTGALPGATVREFAPVLNRLVRERDWSVQLGSMDIMITSLKSYSAFVDTTGSYEIIAYLTKSVAPKFVNIWIRIAKVVELLARMSTPEKPANHHVLPKLVDMVPMRDYPQFDVAVLRALVASIRSEKAVTSILSREWLNRFDIVSSPFIMKTQLTLVISLVIINGDPAVVRDIGLSFGESIMNLIEDAASEELTASCLMSLITMERHDVHISHTRRELFESLCGSETDDIAQYANALLNVMVDP